MGGKAASRIGLSRLHYPVLTLGPGKRAGIWMQGCSIRCLGCIAIDTWDPPSPDQMVDVNEVVRWLEARTPSGVDGITISGGEPFDQPQGLRALAEAIRRAGSLAHADLFVYSGYPLATLERHHPEILSLLDAVMSGPYVAALPSDSGWRGSSNQRLTLLTPRAREHFGRQQEPAAGHALQVSVAGDRVWFTGVPRSGDMERLDALLEARGVRAERASWRN